MPNQFVFTCPIFNVETKFAACQMVRDRLWRGQETPVRRGCQACMRSNKCPVSRELSRARQQSKSLDHYEAFGEIKRGKLRAEVLREVLVVRIQQPHVDAFMVPPAEQALIDSANQRIAAQLKSAPEVAMRAWDSNGGLRSSRTILRGKRAGPTTFTEPKPKAVGSEIQSAAATGDLAAAISHAA